MRMHSKASILALSSKNYTSLDLDSEQLALTKTSGTWSTVSLDCALPLWGSQPQSKSNGKHQMCGANAASLRL